MLVFDELDQAIDRLPHVRDTGDFFPGHVFGVSDIRIEIAQFKFVITIIRSVLRCQPANLGSFFPDLQCAFIVFQLFEDCLLYTSPSPRDLSTSRMPSSA